MDPQQRFERAAKRYRKAQDALAAQRVELYEAARDARAAGMTLDAMGRVLGVSRQRILSMLEKKS